MKRRIYMLVVLATLLTAVLTWPSKQPVELAASASQAAINQFGLLSGILSTASCAGIVPFDSPNVAAAPAPQECSYCTYYCQGVFDGCTSQCMSNGGTWEFCVSSCYPKYCTCLNTHCSQCVSCKTKQP